MHGTNCTTGFSGRPSPHAHLRRAARLRRRASASLLMGWVHRRRDLGGVIFIHLRDRDGVTQVVFHEDVDAAVHGKAELLRAGVRGRGRRHGGAALAGDHQPEHRHRRGRGGGGEALDPQRIPHAAVPHGRARGRQRGRAPEVPLRRPAPPAHAAQHHAALEDRLRRARVPVLRRASSRSRRRS